MRRAAKGIVWFAALVGVALVAYFLMRPVSPALTYSTAQVTRGDMMATVSATGTLSPLITVRVGSQVSGTIQSLHADFNDKVTKGAVIARIEPSLFRADVAQAEANLRNAVASRDKAAVAVEETRRNLERVRRLRQQKMVPESDLDTADFAHRSAAVELQVREAAVAQARAALEKSQVNLAHTVIYAPIDGVVISRDVDVGQTVAASLQAPVLFTIAQDLRKMQIETEVDEAFIGQVHEEQPVRFTVFAYPERTFQGEVAQIRLNPTVEAGVVKYNVIVRVDNQDLALKPGMTATVAIEVAQRKAVLKVPNQALRFVPEVPADQLAAVRERLKRGEAVLWTPVGGELKPLVVRVGLAGERETEVSAQDLQEGTAVAVPVKTDSRRRGQGGPPRGLSPF